MASKRKSSTPCMIPSKLVRLSEEVDLDSHPLLVPSRGSGGGAGLCGGLSPSLSPGLSPVHGAAESCRADPSGGGGIYTCKPCHFETPDLNLFLDHVYSGHPDFRADPGFLCVSCGVSAPKFEGLALHNARVHPSTLSTSLQLRRRKERRAVVVEQHLAVAPETSANEQDPEIHITKTPIMRSLRAKSEVKRGIVVSHQGSGGGDEASADSSSSGPASKEVEKKEVVVPSLMSGGTTRTPSLPSAIQIVNGSGALPLLKTPITQVVSVVQNRNLHSTPLTASSNNSSPASKNLPKVMIPLSSIPTYSASMDSSSFLKSSFSKFPYPTKAELCYLTVVTKFPEEQIKIWFTAQRLKQGISWSPEEIEEARRKMFNTIIQTASSSSTSSASSSSSSSAALSQSQRVPATQTIAVLPGGIPHLLQGSLVGQGGVIVTQPLVANGLHVSSAPVALAVTPKPQAAARPMMQARPAAALVADKGVGMVVGTVGSSSSGGGASSSSIITSSSSSIQPSVINLSRANQASANQANANHSGAKGSPVNGTVGGSKVEAKERNKSDTPAKSSSSVVPCDGRAVTQGNDKSSESRAKDDEEEEKNKKSSNSTSSSDGSGPSSALAGAEEPVDLEAGDSPSSPSSKSSSSPSPAVCAPSSSLLDSGLSKSKKSQGQLSALKDSFQCNQFPDQEEVERLITLTGLTIREVRKWFSDRRYHHRNLKGPRGGGATARGGAGGGANPMDTAPVSPTASLTPTSPSTPSRRGARVPSPDFTAIRYKEREPHQVKALEASFLLEEEPSAEEVERLRMDTKMTRREIHSWFAERRRRAAAERKREEAEQALQKEEELEEQQEQEEDQQRDDGEPKVNPIKINLKMLKVTEAKVDGEGAGPPVTPPPTPLSRPAPPTSKPPPASRSPAVRGKKTAEQLELLKRVYARTQWPSAAQYEQLIAGTGLPRPDVVRWFGDSRYTQKNSQLKWLEAYQDGALEEELPKAHSQVLQEHLRSHGRLEESQLQTLATASGLTSDLVRHWFSRQPSLLTHPEPASAATPGAGAAAAAAAPAAAAPGAGAAAQQHSSGSSPLAPQPGGGSEEKMEQSVCGGETEGGAAETSVSPAEGSG